MNHSSSSVTDSVAAKLARITRASNELDRCVRERGNPDQDVRWGVTLGEMDWLQELHLAIYDN